MYTYTKYLRNTEMGSNSTFVEGTLSLKSVMNNGESISSHIQY